MSDDSERGPPLFTHDGPAFPWPGFAVGGQWQQGLSVRDYFAAKAMQSLIHEGAKIDASVHERFVARLSIAAYEIADAMIAERAK